MHDIDKDLPINTGDLIARICKAASERWPEDQLAPGVQIAHLAGIRYVKVNMTPVQLVGASAVGLSDGDVIVGAQWYVALHRYPKPTTVCHSGDTPRVIQFRTKHADLDLALLDIAKQLYAACVVTERNELEALLAAALKVVS